MLVRITKFIIGSVALFCLTVSAAFIFGIFILLLPFKIGEMLFNLYIWLIDVIYNFIINDNQNE